MKNWPRSLMWIVLLGPIALAGVIGLAVFTVSLVSPYLLDRSRPNNGYDITQYIQTQTNLRVTVTVAGILILIWAIILLCQRPREKQEAMNDLGRLFGIAVLATGLGLLYYGLVPRHDKFLDKYYFSSVPNAHGSYQYPVQPKRRAPATVASNAEFIEARSGFRAGVTLTGVAILIAALGLLLQRPQEDEPAAMYDLGRIVGIAFLALGLALLYYGQVGP